jgi:transposase-like protein
MAFLGCLMWKVTNQSVRSSSATPSTAGGFFHIDIAEVQTAGGKLYMFVGIDRTSKFAVTQLVEKADRKTAWEFLQILLEAVPYRVHTILTDNGIQFA